MAHTITQLRAAALQGATIVTNDPGYEKGSEVEYIRHPKEPWHVKGLTGIDRVASSTCEIVWEPGCRKAVHIPTIKKLVKKHFEGSEHQQANMPLHGGWAVSQTYWNMESVAFVHWAYAGLEADGALSNMVDRRLTDEVRGMHALLKGLGYKVSSLVESRNFFTVGPA